MKYKQSSVDFYAEKSLDLFNLFQQGSISINDFRARMLIIEIEAKEIEKEQSVKFALYYAFGEQEVSEDLKINIEKLYNETYGGNK